MGPHDVIDQDDFCEENGFCDRLDKMIRRQRLTQTELGRLVGVGQPHISGLRRGKSRPSQDLVTKLAQALNCSAQWLAYGTGDIGGNSSVVVPHDLKPMILYVLDAFAPVEISTQRYELMAQVYQALEKVKALKGAGSA